MGKTNKKEELSVPVMIFCIVGVVLVVFGFLLLKNDNFKLNNNMMNNNLNSNGNNSAGNNNFLNPNNMKRG